jgi:hypothetical protein
LLLNEFILGLLEIGLLHTNDIGQKLVFKTTFSYDEVNDGAHSSYFRLIVRVLHLGL